MAKRLSSRAAMVVLTSFAVVLLAFLFQFVLPGDPARSLVPKGRDVSGIAIIRQQLHLNDPLLLQFKHYFLGVLHGNLGTSYVYREPVSHLIWQRVPATAEVAAAGLLVTMILGLSLGMWAALNGRARRGVHVVSVGLITVPSFVLGLLLLLLFGFKLHIAPVTGGGSLSALVLPAITLGLVGLPYYLQVVTEEATRALASPYARTAVAKGLSNRQIVIRHTLRNIASPITTMLALDLAQYMSGLIIIESVFGWPGLGQLAVRSLSTLDRPVVLGITMVVAVSVSLFNLVADVLRMIIDPRARVGIT